jgi:hypothetical protein
MSSLVLAASSSLISLGFLVFGVRAIKSAQRVAVRVRATRGAGPRRGRR